MFLRNRDLQEVLREIDRELSRREADIRNGARFTTELITQVTELREVRWRVRRVLLNRQVVAAKKVVDFGRWVDGDGELRPCRVKSQP
jgi:hypothetical protein